MIHNQILLRVLNVYADTFGHDQFTILWPVSYDIENARERWALNSFILNR